MQSNFSNTTDTSKAGLNLTLKPLDRFVLNGFQSRCTNLFECLVTYIASANESAHLTKLFGGTPDRPALVTYPYMLLRLTDIAPNNERTPANIKHLLRQGIPVVRTGQASDEAMQARAFALYAMPTTFNISFKYVTNSWPQGWQFAKHMIMYSTKGGVLDFNIQYGSASFSVKTREVTTVAIPEGTTASGAAGSADEYVFTGTLTVDGWSSLDTLVERQIVHTLDVDLSLSTDQTMVWKSTPEADLDLFDNVDGLSVDGGDPDAILRDLALTDYNINDASSEAKFETAFALRGRTHNSIKPADQTKSNIR